MLKERTEKKRGVAGRITPRDALRAYEVTGWEATRNEHIDDEGGSVVACGLYAYAGMIAPNAGPIHNNLLAVLKDNFDMAYMDGFVAGFDGSVLMTRPKEDVTLARKGWRDGQRAARFVFGDSDA